jgi:hypothetical protein
VRNEHTLIGAKTRRRKLLGQAARKRPELRRNLAGGSINDARVGPEPKLVDKQFECHAVNRSTDSNQAVVALCLNLAQERDRDVQSFHWGAAPPAYALTDARRFSQRALHLRVRPKRKEQTHRAYRPGA